MAKANGWNLRWHCQLHDMKIGQNPSQVPNDFPIFPYLIKWTQKDIQTKDFFFNNNGNIVAKWLLQLLRTIFSFQPIDASLSLSLKKKNENFPPEQVSYFLKWPAVPP